MSMSEGEDRLLSILDLVIENYISKGDPIGSKFLHSLEETDYAPSTLRKYLNMLEKEGFLYQPYNSAGRVPTIKAYSNYIENILQETKFEIDEVDFDVDFARNSMRYIVEKLGDMVDGAVVGFLRNDEYYFLGINNLLAEEFSGDYDTVRHIVKFIEHKKIIEFLNEKMTKAGKIYYTFIHDGEKDISTVYIKIVVNGFEGILAIIGPLRVNYRKNLATLQKFLGYYLKDNR